MKYRQAVETFPSFFEETRKGYLETCLEHIGSSSAQLDRPVEGKPATISDKNLKAMSESFEPYSVVLEEGQWSAVQKAMDQLRAKSGANRKERAKLITVLPDPYSGEDAGQIKAWSEDLAGSRPGEIKILKTVVTKDDWEERSLWEDYAGDQRFVTRRQIFTQVAVREGDSVLLHSIAVNKELRSDGTWSGLKGNIMWSEEMLEDNVG